MTEHTPDDAPLWDQLLAVVNYQAEDEGLWFVAHTVSEAYLQQALRLLHATIERCAPTATPDAHLIAAAPELLAALKFLDQKGGLGADVHAMIRAAIAKATGR
jgi:hypothetical protein